MNFRSYQMNSYPKPLNVLNSYQPTPIHPTITTPLHSTNTKYQSTQYFPYYMELCLTKYSSTQHPKPTKRLQHTTNNNLPPRNKITSTKSTKYIENLFPNYKLIFNNTHLLTNCIDQRRTHIPRSGLLTLVHKKYAFPGNLNKIPTPHNISPYLQIIQINNQPLQPWLLLHLYMPTNEDDIRLIPEIQTNITNAILKYPNHLHILYGDFNRDIALITRKTGQDTNPPKT